MPASSVRMASVTSSLPSQIWPPSKRTGSWRARAAMRSSCSASMGSPVRVAARAVMRYIAPESRKAKPRRWATAAATVPLPEAEGPSMQMTGIRAGFACATENRASK